MIDDPVIGEEVSLTTYASMRGSMRRVSEIIRYENFIEIVVINGGTYEPETLHRVIWTFAGPKRITWRSHNPQQGTGY